MQIVLGLLLLILSGLSWAKAGGAKPQYSHLVPYPFYAQQQDMGNKLMPIFDGRLALAVRLEMIQRAKKNIEVEYFIYNTDLASKLITRELVKAAERGVKIRMLIDKSIVFTFKKPYVKQLAKHGIEVRFYNNSHLVQISSVQFRNHRKLLSVDDREPITGGRNIGDDYFDLSHEFDFTDTDVHVEGPIVKVMRESFDKFFDNRMAHKPKLPAKDSAKAIEFLKPTKEEQDLRASLLSDQQKNQSLLRSYDCPLITYASDGPGANFTKRLRPDFDEKYKFLRKVLFDKLSEVDQSVLISSPYLLTSRLSKRMMDRLLARNVSITAYTNSLASTDAVYVAANLYVNVFNWTRKGIDIYLHDGSYMEQNSDLEKEVQNAHWGTHTKAQVYHSKDWSEAMIGTYNIDNRSNFYNAEMAIFCRGNDEYTEAVEKDIKSRITKAIKINPDRTATYQDGRRISIYGVSKKKVLKMHLISIPSWLLKFLL